MNFRTNSKYDDIKNSFEIIFKSNKSNDTLYYQCSFVKLYNLTHDICFKRSSYDIKGNYEIFKYNSLGIENKFNLGNSITIKYYGNDTFYLFFHKVKFYVSESGSKIVFYSRDCVDCQFFSNIYPNSKSETTLEDCHQLEVKNIDYFLQNYPNYYIVYCNIKEKELDYFNYSYSIFSTPKMAYDNNCGVKKELEVTIYKLDKNKYPLIRVKKLIIPNDGKIEPVSIFTLIEDIEGSIKSYGTSLNNKFNIFVNAEINKNENKTFILYCWLINIKIMENFEINCYPTVEATNTTYFNNVYLLPYFYPTEDLDPYDVIISKPLKGLNSTDLEKEEEEKKEEEDNKEDKEREEKKEEEDNKEDKEREEKEKATAIIASSSILISVILICIFI